MKYLFLPKYEEEKVSKTKELVNYLKECKYFERKIRKNSKKFFSFVIYYSKKYFVRNIVPTIDIHK